MMEVVLSEEKAEINNYDIDECYNKIDKYFSFLVVHHLPHI